MALTQDKAPTKVLSEYADYTDVFSFDLIRELRKNTNINKHAIELQDSKQPLYRPIYSLELMELKTLKTYIKIHLKIGLIWPFKSPAGASILCEKLDESFYLCVDYQRLNDLTIKNWYPLPLIDEALNQLDRAKQFT